MKKDRENKIKLKQKKKNGVWRCIETEVLIMAIVMCDKEKSPKTLNT